MHIQVTDFGTAKIFNSEDEGIICYILYGSHFNVIKNDNFL